VTNGRTIPLKQHNFILKKLEVGLTILRVALETSVVAARCALADDQARWECWNGGSEFKFGNACDEVLRLPDAKAREDEVAAQFGVGIFRGSVRSPRDAWARSLYGRLCCYSHARGDTTDASIWNGNGPVYSADGLKACYETFLETYALVFMLAGFWRKISGGNRLLVRL
jgi:hypothetical protein